MLHLLVGTVFGGPCDAPLWVLPGDTATGVDVEIGELYVGEKRQPGVCGVVEHREEATWYLAPHGDTPGPVRCVTPTRASVSVNTGPDHTAQAWSFSVFVPNTVVVHGPGCDGDLTMVELGNRRWWARRTVRRTHLGVRDEAT